MTKAIPQICFILTATGAWFTSNDYDTVATQTFGHVEISLTDGVAEVTKADDTYLLPGDKLADFTITNESNVQIYVRYKVEFAVTGAATVSEVDNAQMVLQKYLNGLFSNGGWYYVATAGSSLSSLGTSSTTMANGAAIADGAEMYMPGATIAGGSVGNDAQDAVVSITLTVQAIQVGNFDNVTAAWAAYTANGLVA